MASSGEELTWNITSLHPGSRHLLQAQNGDAVYFVDYKPPARDTITLPRNLLYVLAGVLLVVVATYAIVSHLINDLMHDLADWVLGPKSDVEDAERGPDGGDEDDDDSDDDDDNIERRRMSGEVHAIEKGAGLLPGFQRCSSVSYPCTNQHGGRAGFLSQHRASYPLSFTKEISISIPHVTSL